MSIAEAIIEKVNNGRSPLGVTGSIGCGKTFVCTTLRELADNQGIITSYVSVDSLRRNILGTDAKYEKVRTDLTAYFGERIRKPDGSICGKELGQIIYYEISAMDAYKGILYPAINQSLGFIMKERNGLLFLEWSCLVEEGLLPLVEGNALVITCDYYTQVQRLIAGDLPLSQLQKRIEHQLSNNEKISGIKEYQKNSGSGRLYVFDTGTNPGPEQYMALLEDIMHDLISLKKI